MKIVYMFQSLAKVAGTERILTDKMNFFAEKEGYEVYLITSEQGDHNPPFKLSQKIKHIDLNIRFFTLYKYSLLKRIVLSYWMNIQYRKKFRKAIKKIKPDIVCCTTYASFEIKALVGLKDNYIKIIEAHTSKNSNEKQRFYKKGTLLHFLAKQYDNKVYNTIKKTTVLVTLTHGDAYNWKDIKIANVIPNILTHYPNQIISNISNNRVISIGRLTEQKGFSMLIDAWNIVHEKHPNWTIEIYGTGEEKDMLIKQIQEYNMQQVIFINNPVSNIYDKYLESDFYVMSSRWEGFALVLLEAMSCGIPCVSFDCPHGPSDIIQDGIDGLLVENGDIEQLAEKICYMIEHEDIRKNMGLRARKNVKRYLPENIMPMWEKLFNDLLTERTS